MIEAVVRPPVQAAEAFADDPAVVLFPSELAVAATASQRRRREFATARGCAHAALAGLGLPSAAILPDRRGAPIWPEGVVGSITHCSGYRAAAVAPAGQGAAVGLGAEPAAADRRHAGRYRPRAGACPAGRTRRAGARRVLGQAAVQRQGGRLQGLVPAGQALAGLPVRGRRVPPRWRHLHRAPAGAGPAGGRVAADHAERAVARRPRAPGGRGRDPGPLRARTGGGGSTGIWPTAIRATGIRLTSIRATSIRATSVRATSVRVIAPGSPRPAAPRCRSRTG